MKLIYLKLAIVIIATEIFVVAVVFIVVFVEGERIIVGFVWWGTSREWHG